MSGDRNVTISWKEYFLLRSAVNAAACYAISRTEDNFQRMLRLVNESGYGPPEEYLPKG